MLGCVWCQNKGGEPSNFYEASASSAVMAANRLQAKCIVVHTESGEEQGRREGGPR